MAWSTALAGFLDSKNNCSSIVNASAHLVRDDAIGRFALEVQDEGIVFKLHPNATIITEYVQTTCSERWVAGVIRAILARASAPVGRRPVMIDIGANNGYYGMLGLALGAQAIMLDVQPTCWDHIQAAVDMNAFGSRAQLVRHGVSTLLQPEFIRVAHGKMAKSARYACDGHFGVRALAPSYARDATGLETSSRDVKAITFGSFHEGLLGSILNNTTAEIDLVKLDVEGAEVGILNGSLMPLLRARRIRNLIFEANPQWWRSGLIDKKNDQRATFRIAQDLATEIAYYGYRLNTRYCESFRHIGTRWPSPCQNATYYVIQMRKWKRAPPLPQDLHFQRLENWHQPTEPAWYDPNCTVQSCRAP